ncbi:hypothetical protein LMIY3S_03545 [Labrys miyagiensis]
MTQASSFSLSSNRVTSMKRPGSSRAPMMEAEHQLMSMLAAGSLPPAARAEMEKALGWYQRNGRLHHASLHAFAS